MALEELKQIKGIGKVKAIQIKAICELAIRMSKPSNYKKVRVLSSEHLAGMLMQELRFEKREYVKLILLNNKNEILKIINISQGGTNFANVNIMEIIGEAIKIKAPKMILVHNHPSGDPTPSKADIKITDEIYNAARIFQIDLIDHLVIGDGKYRSIFVELKQKIEKIKNNKGC